MKQREDQVSSNLLKLRENRNLSLDKLAELTGVSKSMLRQIETGKSSPTIATIWKIASGLKVSFTSLLKSPETRAVVKAFKDEAPHTGKGEQYRLFPLVPFDPQRSFEIYYIEIEPDTTFEGEPHEGDVEGYIFVISGELEVLADGKAYTAGKDQFVQFQANCPHTYTCTGDQGAAAMLLLTYL